MRFAAGENFAFSLIAKGFNFGLGDEIARENDLDRCAMQNGKEIDLFDSG